MGVKRKDITGSKFNMLTVMKPTGEVHKTRGAFYECLCDCGGSVVAHYSSITQGIRKSCGCLWISARDNHNNNYKDNGRTHGLSNHPLYGTHKMMINRCQNTEASDYYRYGEIGVTVSDEWSEPDGKGFLNFISDMGERPTPKHSVDRINNKKGYSKENCKWSDKTVQQVNKKRTIQPGIYKTKNGSRWCAKVFTNGSNVVLGTFDTYSEALSVRRAAELKYYGQYVI